ncbi:radical SAM protein [Candidatus Uabimicrobium sp. HlEnr_7]|uniref:radical SAM protein n=1 Tax=Candidatus Uabimicrobium helgolandensis TaxID=3095367 RepID=UPI003557F6D1
MQEVQENKKEKQVELSSIHDFAAKLLQPETIKPLKEYVKWQSKLRNLPQETRDISDLAQIPDFAPISINLDITTSCNYACDHCVDMDILNKAIRYNHERLLDSIKLMADKGLKSIIVIGGGEPTLYPKFTEAIRFMKSLGLQIAIVSNGSRNEKIAEIADCLGKKDWVRLSLDSGGDDVFQKMHKPRKPVSLPEICEKVSLIKKVNADVQVGFSYIITWKGAFINDTDIVENIHEMVTATKLAKDSGFDYISFKPFLTRAEDNNAEIVDLKEKENHFAGVIKQIQEYVAEAKKLEDDNFKVYESTNLKVLMNNSASDYMQQPQMCHMQFFRQVLSPLGMFNCPVYRNQPHGKLGARDTYSTTEKFGDVKQEMAQQLFKFNATQECKEVTCLYNHVNWWIEDLIANPHKLNELKASEMIEPDYYL